MRVVFAQSIAWMDGIHRVSYSPADGVVELDDARAAKFIRAGVCKPARGRPAKRAAPELAVLEPDEDERER